MTDETQKTPDFMGGASVALAAIEAAITMLPQVRTLDEIETVVAFLEEKRGEAKAVIDGSKSMIEVMLDAIKKA